MSQLREAAQQALEALDGLSEDAVCQSSHHAKTDQHTSLDVCPVFLRLCVATTALRAALAEPVQEQPVCDECGKSKCDGWALYCVNCMEPVFDSPQRKPLTEEEIEKAYREIWRDLPSDFAHTSSGWIEMGIRYAERAQGIGGKDD